MSTALQAATIDALCHNWLNTPPNDRATAVIKAARDQMQLPLEHVNAQALAVAMMNLPYWGQGPSNYLDMAQALQRSAHLLEPVKKLRKAAERVARLSPDAERIGAGMLRQIVTEAQDALDASRKKD